MKHFDEAATRAPLGFDRLVPALRAAFAAGAQVPPRHVHAIEADGSKGTVLIMPAWSDAGFLGIKTINIFPGNGAQGLPGLHATYVLYDARTGVPLAMMDGNEITARRTAAASALGASFLARQDSRRLLVLGTGRIARMLPAARERAPHRRTVGVEPSAGRRGGPGGAMARRGLERPGGHRPGSRRAGGRHRELRHAGHRAAGARRMAGTGLAPGPDRQLHPCHARGRRALLRGRARLYDTEEALQKSGDLLDAMAAGTLRAEDVRGTLATLCRRNSSAARTRPRARYSRPSAAPWRT